MEKVVNVSVVMSAYNSVKYLSNAIESILQQTYRDFEFIIVNDCSTDNTLEIIESFAKKDDRIVIVNNVINSGVSKSCNHAINKIAKGNYIVRMDSDDIAKPERIKKLVDFLDQNSDVVVVGSNADFIDMNGEYIFTSNLPISDANIRKSLLKRATFINPTVAFRKESFVKIGGYYEPIKHYFEDYMLWIALSKIGQLAILNESLLEYRVVMNSISSKEVSKEYKILEREIVHKGFATAEELNFIEKEKSIKSSPKNSELAYYLILSQKYIFDNYNLLKAKENLSKAKEIDPNSRKLKLLRIALLFPKPVLQIIFKMVRK